MHVYFLNFVVIIIIRVFLFRVVVTRLGEQFLYIYIGSEMREIKNTSASQSLDCEIWILLSMLDLTNCDADERGLSNLG